jgi:hypothetical protein
VPSNPITAISSAPADPACAIARRAAGGPDYCHRKLSIIRAIFPGVKRDDFAGKISAALDAKNYKFYYQ